MYTTTPGYENHFLNWLDSVGVEFELFIEQLLNLLYNV
jgi:hypothetical protein